MTQTHTTDSDSIEQTQQEGSGGVRAGLRPFAGPIAAAVVLAAVFVLTAYWPDGALALALIVLGVSVGSILCEAIAGFAHAAAWWRARRNR